MTYAVVQIRRFARAYKKLHANVAADVDDTQLLDVFRLPLVVLGQRLDQLQQQAAIS